MSAENNVIITCWGGRQLFHGNDMMDVIRFEYVDFPGFRKYPLKTVYGSRKLFCVNSSVERFVRQYQSDSKVLMLSPGRNSRHRLRLPAESFRAGRCRNLGGGYLNRFFQSIFEHAEFNGALAPANISGCEKV